MTPVLSYFGFFVCFFSVPTGPSLSAVSTPGGATQEKRSHGPAIIAVIRTVAMAVGQLQQPN